MKKLIALLLILTLVFTLCACASSNGNTATSADDQTNDDAAANNTPNDDAAADDDKRDIFDGSGYRFGGTIYNYNDVMENLNREAATVLADEYGIDISWVDAANDSPTQISQVNSFVTQGMDAIYCNIVDPSAAATVIDSVKADEIPVVIVNHAADDDVIASYDYIWNVGCDSVSAGRLCGEDAANYFLTVEGADRNGDGIAQYCVIEGLPGNFDSDARIQYFVEALTEGLAAEGIEVEEVAHEICTSWSAAESYDKGINWLSSIGAENIDFVMTANDDMTIGICQAFATAGINEGDQSPENFIPCYGVDGTYAAKEYISAGKMKATCASPNADIAAACLNTLLASLNGYEVNTENIGFTVDENKFVWVPYVYVDMNNVAEYMD